MVKEKLNLKCNVKLYEEGKLVLSKDNLVTDSGAEIYSNLISGDVSQRPIYLGVDQGAGTYSKATTELFNETLRKAPTSETSPDSEVVKEFLINGGEAVGQIYGFGLNTDSSSGVYTNLLNLSYLHQAGKQLKLIWTISII